MLLSHVTMTFTQHLFMAARSEINQPPHHLSAYLLCHKRTFLPPVLTAWHTNNVQQVTGIAAYYTYLIRRVVMKWLQGYKVGRVVTRIN